MRHCLVMIVREKFSPLSEFGFDGVTETARHPTMPLSINDRKWSSQGGEPMSNLFVRTICGQDATRTTSSLLAFPQALKPISEQVHVQFLDKLPLSADPAPRISIRVNDADELIYVKRSPHSPRRF